MLIGFNINSQESIENICKNDANYFQIFTSDPTKFIYNNKFSLSKETKKYIKDNNIGIL